MHTKKIIKIGIIVAITVLVIALLLFVNRNRIPLYLGGSEKEFTVTTSKKNNEAGIYINIDKNKRDKLQIILSNEKGEEIKPYNIADDRYDTNRIKYMYDVASGKSYVVKVENITEELFFSKIEISTTN
ncbi:hypothetical protein [Listeria rustica]|uniref:Uncharacterized protein n=1 Tax=Listeria rustica TaxID=2713503 RepID=A0A7W1YHI7_9LIST|nr:hypothetical protein [Listeria rustica]MBA3927723.1 hypothetical protein [Listeria rustica]